MAGFLAVYMIGCGGDSDVESDISIISQTEG